MRKPSLALFVASIGIFLLAGVALAQPVEIDYWGVWGGVHYEVEQSIIAEFNRQFEGRIHVTGIELPAPMEERLPTAVVGGAPPAVAKVDRFRIGSFASAHLLQAIDPLIERDAYPFTEHYPASREETIFNGQIYAIPWNTDARAMYYNTRLFQEAGLDINAPPATWEEVDKASRSIDRRNPDGELTQAGFVPHWGNWGFLAWLWAAGGDLLDESNRHVTWNSAEGARALQWMRDRVDGYGGMQAIDAFNGASPNGAWFGGRLGMNMEGSFAIGDLRYFGIIDEVQVANPPRPAGLEGTPVTWSGGFALAIPTGVSGAEREAAWEFIKFYTDHWAQVTYGSQTGQIPSLRSAATSSTFLETDPMIQLFVELMPYSHFRPVIPAGGEMWSMYWDEINALFAAGEMPVEQILDETARQAQLILDDAWERVESGR